jgi:hypothetical protein
MPRPRIHRALQKIISQEALEDAHCPFGDMKALGRQTL